MIQLQSLTTDTITILDHQDNTVEIDRERFEEWLETDIDTYWEEHSINDAVFKVDMEAYLIYIHLLSQEGLS